MKRFFVGCNLKFEDALELELQEVWPFLLDLDGRPHAYELKVIDKIPGGILLEAPLHLGLQLNSFCKLANRVLLRISEFKVKDFPKMVQKFKDIKKDVLLKDLNLDFEIAASKSRLNNEKRIAEICYEVFGKPRKEADLDFLYIRMFDDLCTVSLDTTGDHLHFRSEKNELGKAPIRETIAAFCLRAMCDGYSRSHLSEIALIDPMVGTGTFLKESHSLYSRSLRFDFPYLRWPLTPKLLKSESLAKNDLVTEGLFKQLRGYDKDPQVLAIAQDQLQGIMPLENLQRADLFHLKPMAASRNWIISNPPYGERIKADFSVSDLFRQVIDVFNPEQIGFVLSEGQFKELLRVYEQSQSPHIASEDRMHLKGNWPFSNGGILVRFVLFSRFV